MGLPIPNLDDKTFQDLVEESLALLRRYDPDNWTDHNAHDPGITFIELFAWLAEMQIYQLNTVSELHYKKFLKLAGYTPHTAQPARVNVTFNNILENKIMPAGTQIFTLVDSEKIVFETDEDLYLNPAILKKVVSAYHLKTFDHSSANERDDVYFPPFGENASIGSEFHLGFDKPLSDNGLEGQKIQITFFMYEKDLPPIGSHGDEQARILPLPQEYLDNNDSREEEKRIQIYPSTKLEWEYLSSGKWVALNVEEDTTLAMNRSGTVKFAPPSPGTMVEKGELDIMLRRSLHSASTGPGNDGLYWVRCRLAQGKYEIVPHVNMITLNTVTASQVETVKDEDLGTGPGLPDHKITLENAPVLAESLPYGNITGSPFLIQIQNEVYEWEDWKLTNNFEESGPNDRHYRLDTETGEITFGNGMNGCFPLESRRTRASFYKTTSGLNGNIHKGRKWGVNTTGFTGIFGENREDAKGGRDAESTEHAKSRAKKDFNTQYRAVTSGDYEKLAISTPGLRVARAKAIPNYLPNMPCIKIPGHVTVVIVPYAREGTDIPVPGENFIKTVSAHLNRHRLVTTNVHVVGQEYVKISVECKVRTKKTYDSTKVKERSQKSLRNFLSPLKGGPDGTGWPFGRSVYPSEIYQLIDKVEGVDYVTCVVIKADDKYKKKDEDIVKIPPVGLVYLVGELDIEILE